MRRRKGRNKRTLEGNGRKKGKKKRNKEDKKQTKRGRKYGVSGRS